MKKLDEELLINYYYYGWELSSDNAEFPVWFESYEEKIACLCGYQDFDLGIERDNIDIINEINKYIYGK